MENTCKYTLFAPPPSRVHLFNWKSTEEVKNGKSTLTGGEKQDKITAFYNTKFQNVIKQAYNKYLSVLHNMRSLMAY